MSEELKPEMAGHDPAAEMQTAMEFVGEVQTGAPPVAELQADGPTVDRLGVTFDPAIHKADSDGNPRLGSKNQFLLKKEAKKTASQKIREGINHLFGKKPEEEKNSNSEGIPLSDHEFEQQSAQGEAKLQETREADLAASAEASAELYFFAGSMALGMEFSNQRDAFFDRVAGHFRRYEERTGKRVDLPHGVALALGLGQIGYVISRREPACKKRLDSAVEIARKNVGEYLSDKIPMLGRAKESERKEEVAQ